MIVTNQYERIRQHGYRKIMHLKRKYHKKIKYYFFLNTKSTVITKKIFTLENDEAGFDIVTIAFNNPLMIEYQVRLLRKNVTDKFTHIVADNSSDPNARVLISETCKRLGVMYVSIPSHGYAKNDSHSVAMHWVYKNVIRKRNAKYFGFLDHDIFPIKPCTIIGKFKNNIYGRITPPYGPNGETLPVTEKQPHWSLWAGFCFFKSNLLYDINIYDLNFFVRKTGTGQLDTGGGLWDSVLKKIPFPGELAKVGWVKFRESQDSNIHTDYYECLDDWIHIGNLSNWYNTPDYQGKVDYFESVLKRLCGNEA